MVPDRTSTGQNFSFLLEFSAATTGWFYRNKKWLQSASSSVRFCTSRKICCHLCWKHWIVHPSTFSQFSTKKLFNYVWTFTKVQIVGASQLFQRSSSVLSQGFWFSREHAVNWWKNELFFRIKSEKVFRSCTLFNLYASFSVNFMCCYFVLSFLRVKAKAGDSFLFWLLSRHVSCFDRFVQS